MVGEPGISPPHQLVGALGIEPSLPAPKAGVLPVYYAPVSNWCGGGPGLSAPPPAIALVGMPRIELGLPAPKADVLPVYYSPCKRKGFSFLIFCLVWGQEAGVLPVYLPRTILPKAKLVLGRQPGRYQIGRIRQIRLIG